MSVIVQKLIDKITSLRADKELALLGQEQVEDGVVLEATIRVDDAISDLEEILLLAKSLKTVRPARVYIRNPSHFNRRENYIDPKTVSIPRTMVQLEEVPPLDEIPFEVMTATSNIVESFKVIKENPEITTVGLLSQRGMAQNLTKAIIQIPEEEYVVSSTSVSAHELTDDFLEIDQDLLDLPDEALKTTMASKYPSLCRDGDLTAAARIILLKDLQQRRNKEKANMVISDEDFSKEMLADSKLDQGD